MIMHIYGCCWWWRWWWVLLHIWTHTLLTTEDFQCVVHCCMSDSGTLNGLYPGLGNVQLPRVCQIWAGHVGHGRIRHGHRQAGRSSGRTLWSVSSVCRSVRPPESFSIFDSPTFCFNFFGGKPPRSRNPIATRLLAT